MSMSMSKERVWRQAIGDQQRSGTSVRVFCRGRQLNESSFYYWRREIRDREAGSKSGVALVLAPVVLVDEPPGSTRTQLAVVFAVLESARC